MTLNAQTRRSRFAFGARPRWVDGLAFGAVVVLVAASAVVVKELSARGGQSALLAVNTPDEPVVDELVGDGEPGLPIDDLMIVDPMVNQESPGDEAVPTVTEELPGLADTSLRFFNGRPVRKARTIWMTVTAYSPDSRSCGDSADGITASLHRVETNGFKLVAADSKILPLGSMITVPGYDTDRVVPVLDRGGAIKGYRLDILFPTHEQARKWGVKKLPITVWEYADGLGHGDWRKTRDSK
ncbi:MAG: 3D domain-containing protein [Phycisphaerales bacterium]